MYIQSEKDRKIIRKKKHVPFYCFFFYHLFPNANY